MFKKGLGDNLQELTAVVTNGGFSQPEYWYTVGAAETIAPPQDGRFILCTDQPSGTRVMFLLMFAKAQSDINEKAVGGYIGKDGIFQIAARKAGLGSNGTGTGGGGNRKKTRKKTNRRYRSIKKKKRKKRRKSLKRKRKRSKRTRRK